MKSVFEFENYKEFVLHRIATAPQGGRGLRRKLAQAVGCQVAYVSHVLAADRHFSLEQAEAAGRFFSLRQEELEFLLLLVECARAGTHSLRAILKKQIQRQRGEYRELKNRLGERERVTPEDQATYYSSWHYQAIRMILTIPEYRRPKSIADRLGLDVERVNEVLSFFLEKGFAHETREGYQTTRKMIHLGSDSPLLPRMHANWRIRTIESLDRRRAEDYHYSAAVTLSQEDFAKVREILTKSLVQCSEVIGPSREEKLCVLSMDFFEL